MIHASSIRYMALSDKLDVLLVAP